MRWPPPLEEAEGSDSFASFKSRQEDKKKQDDDELRRLYLASQSNVKANMAPTHHDVISATMQTTVSSSPQVIVRTAEANTSARSAHVTSSRMDSSSKVERGLQVQEFFKREIRYYLKDVGYFSNVQY